MPCSAGSSCPLIAALTCTSARCGGSWATRKRTEITSKRFAAWDTCLRGRRRRGRNRLGAASFERTRFYLLVARGSLTRSHWMTLLTKIRPTKDQTDKRLDRQNNNNNEKPLPQDFPVILGRSGAVFGVGDCGDHCAAPDAARNRESGAANFGGGGERLQNWWSGSRSRLSGRTFSHATRAGLRF